MADARAPTLRESLGLLATRRFGTFWIASFLSNLGTWAQQVAEPWLLLGLGASPFLIGLDGFALNAPVLGLTLVGGVLADRADRRRVILGFQSLQMLCPAALVALVAVGAVRPWQVIALSLVVGVTDALSMPSFQSILPSLVERERLGSAYALNSTQFNLARIVGPALAAVLLVAIGAVGCFALNTASYLPFILVALWILPRRRRRGDAAPSRGVVAGYRDLLADPDVRGAVLTVFASGVLSAPLVTFAPVLVKNVLHGSAGHFGGALSAYGIGGLAGALALLAVEGRVERRRFATRVAALWGATVAAAAVARSFSLLTALLVVAGVTMTMSNTSLNSLLQSGAHEQRRGRTASLFMLALRGGLSLGNLATGAVADRIGIQRALLLDGLVCVAAQLAIGHAWGRPARAVAPAHGLQR